MGLVSKLDWASTVNVTAIVAALAFVSAIVVGIF
jgi:hypothetical protein